jgi:peptidoglycan-N-acetylglucosamine deacetylase
VKRSSKHHDMKLIGKLIVCFLFALSVILLFYNNKINNNDTALAKVSKTTKMTSSVLYVGPLKDTSSELLFQNTTLKNSSMSTKELIQKALDYPNRNKFSTDVQDDDTALSPQSSQTNENNQHSNDLKEKEIQQKTESKKNINVKSPIPKSQKVVYLTFDDGPQEVSNQIIKLLKKYNAKATFFMLDPNIKRFPMAVKKMVSEGHSIGAHGVTHDIHKIYRSPDAFVKEMKQTQATLKRVTGVQTYLIRAPYGSVPYMKPTFRKASDAEGFIMWDWDIDSDDWESAHGEFVQSIKKQVENCSAKTPLVVLMHEKPSTVKYLETVLQYFQQKGYKMEAITGALKPVQFKYR